jgi:hypothetical protein
MPRASLLSVVISQQQGIRIIRKSTRTYLLGFDLLLQQPSHPDDIAYHYPLLGQFIIRHVGEE